jgi:DNA-binding Lrp family transcriptional regulator
LCWLDSNTKSNLQLKILRELASPKTGFGFLLRPTYSSIAKKLGIDEETVRVNVRQAERAGTLVRWYLEVNPYVLGHDATSVFLEVNDPSKKDWMINQIKLIPGVILIVDFYERPLRVEFYHENDQDLERKLGFIESITGDKNPIFWKIVYPSSNARLKKTDWQILKSLQQDSMRSNAEIAKEVGVSARTVKRRLSLLIEEEAVYSQMLGDVKRVPGHVYSVLLNCTSETQKREVDEIVQSILENAVFVDTRSKRYSIFSAVFRNMAEAEEMHRKIKSLRGVDNVVMHMEQQVIQVHDWLGREIDNRVLTNAN